jgi:cytochrome c
MKRLYVVVAIVASMTALSGQASAEGDPAKGEKLFNGFPKCHACHSLEPGEMKVGPTLARLFGRKAGSVEGFDKYSDAMVNSGIVWDEGTLNEFLANPKKYIPENSHMVEGYYVVGQVNSDQQRADLIAYLKVATTQ